MDSLVIRLMQESSPSPLHLLLERCHLLQSSVFFIIIHFDRSIPPPHHHQSPFCFTPFGSTGFISFRSFFFLGSFSLSFFASYLMLCIWYLRVYGFIFHFFIHSLSLLFILCIPFCFFGRYVAASLLRIANGVFFSFLFLSPSMHACIHHSLISLCGLVISITCQ